MAANPGALGHAARPSRSWCITINNWTADDLTKVMAVPVQRIIVGQEGEGPGETPHLQGAVVFKKAMRMQAVVNVLGGRASVRVMAGKWEDQIYCAKEGKVVRMEDNAKQGERTDIVQYKDALKSGMDESVLMDKFPSQLAKYSRFEQRVKAIVAKKKSKKFRQIEVHVRWGEAGVGKTRPIMEMDDVYKFNDYEHGWWDGYEGEEILLIDEFYGGIKYSKMLSLLDGYTERIKIKGGFTYALWTTVYITSNKPPEEWYAQGMTPALARRITSIEHLEGEETLIQKDEDQLEYDAMMAMASESGGSESDIEESAPM